MNLELRKSTLKNRLPKITITGSKSESNRLLLLQALYPEIDITNLSNSDDSQLMQKALCSNDEVIDIHHAGTAMRFLTAYFSVQPGREIVITGSKRMKERPIRILVHALTELGADIEYMENTGFPPLKIKGKDFKGGQVTMNANVSSQYISALLLIAPKLKKGIELTLKGNITSSPYILMTLRLLEEIGVNTSFKNNIIKVDSFDKKIDKRSLFVESDWSSASYFYSIIALSKVGTELELSYFKEHSLQGDSSLAKIYEGFGVQTEFRKDSIILTKINSIDSDLIIELDLANSPDIAQTIVVTCFGLGLECKLTGLHTLKIKETDRLVALKTELENLGGQVIITGDSLHLYKSSNIVKDVAISTYNDHRMAMAFAPLALKTSLFIKDSNVVSKSYPDFWKDLESIGIDVININSL
jgi:3-phosphoshikimate 1-carboxyvinyltransferase